MRKPIVLYVDDDLGGLFGRQSLLQENGYNVLITNSARQGLELLSCLPVDAVILDYQMPEANGDRVAAQMKQLRPRVPIMLLSAHESLPEDALKQADAFVSKGEPPQRFVAAVRDLVTNHSPFFARWLRDWKSRVAA